MDEQEVNSSEFPVDYLSKAGGYSCPNVGINTTKMIVRIEIV